MMYKNKAILVVLTILLSFSSLAKIFLGQETNGDQWELAAIAELEDSFELFHSAFSLDGLNKYALENNNGSYPFYSSTDYSHAGVFLDNGCELFESSYGKIYFNYHKLIDDKDKVQNNFIKKFVPGHEMFHAYQYTTAFVKDIYYGTDKEYTFIPANQTCGHVWVIEGTADAVALSYVDEAKHIDHRMLKAYSDKNPRLYGTRRYDIPLDFFPLNDVRLSGVEKLYGSYASSSFWLWLMREYGRDSNRRNMQHYPEILKKLFNNSRSAMGLGNSDKTALKWLKKGIENNTKASLSTLLPDFYSYMGALGDSSLSRKDYYNRLIRPLSQKGKYLVHNNSSNVDFFDAIFHKNKSFEDKDTSCTEVEVKDGIMFNFPIEAYPYTAGCIKLDLSEYKGREVSITARLANESDSYDLINFLHLGWGGFTRSSFIEENKEQGRVKKNSWLMSTEDSSFKENPAKKINITYSVVPSFQRQSNRNQKIRYILEVGNSVNKMKYRGPKKSSSKKAATSKEAFEAKTPGIYEPVIKGSGYGEVANLMTVESDVSVDSDCVPGSYNICQKNQMVLELTEGTAGFDARFVDFDLYKEQLVSPPNFNNLFRGKSARLQLPLLPYGFTGTLNNVGLVFSNGEKAFESVTPEVVNDQNYMATGSVTITEFTPEILKGTYQGILRDTSEDSPLPQVGDVSGDFVIFNPIKYNEELVATSASDYFFRRQPEAITKRFDMPQSIYNTMFSGFEELEQQRRSDFQNLRTLTRYITIPLPTVERPSITTCACSCDLLKSTKATACAPICPKTFNACKNIDSLSKQELLEVFVESFTAQLAENIPLAQAKAMVQQQLNQMQSLPAFALKEAIKGIINY